jgi:hypothetical protein
MLNQKMCIPVDCERERRKVEGEASPDDDGGVETVLFPSHFHTRLESIINQEMQTGLYQ